MSRIKSSISSATKDCRRYPAAAITTGVIAAMLFVGCGYRLSGVGDTELLFASSLKNIAIEGLPRYDDFRMQLKKDLSGYRIKVVAAEAATARIIVTNKELTQQAITIGDDAKVREYLVTALLDFYVITVKGKSKEITHPLQSIVAETTYIYYPQHASLSANEKRHAIAYLNRDLSAELINRLRTLRN